MLSNLIQWQLVIVVWGDKYSACEINSLVASVREKSIYKPRVVIISDRHRSGLIQDVIIRDLPPFYNQHIFKGPGCQAKLSVFEKGLLPTDAPAILLDIDTLVLDDLSHLTNQLSSPKTVSMLQSAILPFGRLSRAIYRLTNKQKYARGNSSVVIFHPAYCHYISDTFQKLYTDYEGINFRPMIADERFISWAAQPHMRAIPRSDVVKFPTEFMWKARWFSLLRGHLPWLRKRWSGLSAITFPGLNTKGQDLCKLSEGSELADSKGRILIWSSAVLGSLKEDIITRYTEIEANMKQENIK